jgi:surface antigen
MERVFIFAPKIIRALLVLTLLAGLAITVVIASASQARADNLGYPWSGAPCEFGSSGGSACQNPNNDNDKYDWFESSDGTFSGGDCGYSGASSECFDKWGYEYRNCTSWVAYRESLIGVTVPRNLGDGGDWYASAPMNERTTTPKAWDVAVEPRSAAHPDGHVAFIESVNSIDPSNPINDNITVSEYNRIGDGNGDTQSGSAAALGFTEFVDFGVHPTGTGGSSSILDGTFIQYNPDTNPNDPLKVYEVVGGAPMYVSGDDAAHLPGWTTAQPITTTQWGSLRQYPADGTFISNVLNNGVYEIVGGAPLYVSGADAQHLPGWATAERAPGWDFTHYEHLRPYPADGTFVSNVQTGAVYEIAGGAPLYVSGDDAASLPGWAHAELAPGWDFTNYQHLWPYPNDREFLSDVQTGMVYEIVGGAPLYVDSVDAPYLPGWSTALRVPHWDFVNFQHLRQYPVDGIFVSNVQNGGVYETVGGAALYVSGADTADMPGWINAFNVPGWDFTNNAHLRRLPADGTYITDDLNGKVYIVAGGAPLYVANWNDVGNPRPTTTVGDWSIANQLHTYPLDGTLVQGFASGEEFEIVGGAAVRQLVAVGSPTTVDDWAIINQLGATE